MSLVNDLLRDLDARQAPAEERAALAGLQAVEESSARSLRRRRRALLGSLLLLLLAAGAAGLWRFGMPLQAGDPAPAPAAAAPVPAPVVPVAPAPSTAPPAPESAAPVDPPLRLLAVLPQHARQGFTLQLLLDGAPSYRRSEQSGVVALHLPHLRLPASGAREGRFERDGRSLAWSLEAQEEGVELLLVGLGDQLQVHDRLEPAGERWQLWVEVPFETPQALPVELDDLPVAGEPLPGAAPPHDPSLAAAPAVRQLPPAPPVVAVQAAGIARQPQVSIASHRPDPLARARRALAEGDAAGALALLEPLQRQQPHNLDLLRTLARAWLAAGQGARLLEELPPRLADFPADHELPLLLARAQLQGGDSPAAVATLRRNPPPLARDPAWHALLAAAYQQTGQWPESAATYRQLLALGTPRPAWQLGLAIALERLGERAEAARHYRQAAQGAGLDDNSRQFARERALALGDAP